MRDRYLVHTVENGFIVREERCEGGVGYPGKCWVASTPEELSLLIVKLFKKPEKE